MQSDQREQTLLNNVDHADISEADRAGVNPEARVSVSTSAGK
jgi:hypothetical protein